MTIPKGFFPEEDTGMVFGFTEASPDISFMGMADRQQRAAAVILRDPDVATVGSAIGGSSSSGNNTGRIFISLEPWNSVRPRRPKSSSGCGQSWPRFPASRPICSRSRPSRSAEG